MKQGWEIKKLRELVTIKTGKLDSNAMVEGGKYPFFTCSREIFAINDYAFDCEAILLAGNNASGDFNVKYYKGKFNAYQRTYVITVNQENRILYSYLYQQLTNHLKKFKEQSLGANTKFLKIGMIQEIEIPLPPLPEQQRIVAILDEAFAAIDKAKANAEQNLKNAKELFESYLQEVFEPKNINCPFYKLSEFLELITYGFTNPMPTTTAGPYMVTAKNVKNGIVDYKTSRHTSQEAFDKLITDKSRPKIGDVLLTKDGTLGRLAVVEMDNLCINQSVALLRPKNQLNSFYLKYILSSRSFQRRMIEQAGGATIKHIYITRVDKMKVPVSDIKEQLSIVQKLDALSAETKRLEIVYQQKLINLEELKKSLLQKAFSGEL